MRISELAKMSDISIGKVLARAQFSNIVGDRKSRVSGFSHIKGIQDYPSLCTAVDYIDRWFKDHQKTLLFGNPLPDSYEVLGKSSSTVRGHSLIAEINWTFLAVRKYSYQISLFLYYKSEFEECILVGELERASELLTKIESEVCFSMWTLENRFLLKELSSVTSAENKEFLSQFNAINKGEGITKSLAHFLSIRAERSLSVGRFNASLINALSALKGDYADENREYYLFKLSFLNNLEFSKYLEILSYDFNNSVIDRYLTLRKVLIYLYTEASTKQREESGVSEALNYLSGRILYLYRKTRDPVLLNLRVLAEGTVPDIDLGDINSLFSQLLDKYTGGLYGEVEDGCSFLLQKFPQYFDLYIIYTKSLAYQGKPFQPVGKTQSSLQNQVLYEMYKIIAVNNGMNEASQNLLRIANNLTSSVLSYGITDFVFYQTKGQTERNMLAKISFVPTNPVIHDCLIDEAHVNKFLASLNAKFPHSLSLQFLNAKREGGAELLKFEKIIPEARYKAELAKKFQHERDYTSAINLWEFIVDKYHDNMAILETAVRNLYYCYQQQKRFDDCIRLYVDSFFLNNFLVDRIAVGETLLAIKKERFRNVSAVVDLPIFYTITEADENETHIAYEKFNVSKGVIRPSELFSKINEDNPTKLLFFLRYTCGQEILKHSIHINGSKERLEERLEICRFLLSADISSNKPFYEDEIKSISNILIIQKGLLELDESKIYVNEQGIIAGELKDFEAVYSRYKTISHLMERNQKLVVLDVSAGLIALKKVNKDGSESEDVTFSDNPGFDIYKELFDAIKEKFLYSKFGIVAYLSTRIRHGVLLGEIRPIFEKHKLITQKEGDSEEYRINNHWIDRFRYDSEDIKNKAQELLKKFSFEVDGLIFDLIKKYLQVYDSIKNPDGWFNYEFDETELFLYSLEATKKKDYSQFVKRVFEVLWARTDTNLIEIRKNIEHETAKSFNELFDRLESSIMEISAYGTQEMITAIKACSTDIQNVIQKISNWFKRSGTQTSDFKLDNLIDIVFEHVNKSYPNRRISLHREISFDETIKGEYYTHFADLFRIFLENILKHSDESVNEIPSAVKITTDESSMNVQISNHIASRRSIEALKGSVNGQNMNLDKLFNEGKSGYHKAMKILTFDLGNEDNQLFTAIKNDEFIVVFAIQYKELVA